MPTIDNKDSYNIQDLVKIVSLLRSPEGCPWDREQTHESLKFGFVEETYEVLEAIDKKDSSMLREELGDVLLQVVFHAQLETENKGFDFDEVCDTICKKLIYRHPHVFSQAKAENSAQVLKRWDELKDAEKGIQTAAQDMQAVPAVFPALMRAQKVQKRAARHGFTYQTSQEALEDLEEEFDELRQAVEKGTFVCEEYGDVLFSLANVGRLMKLNAEEALTQTTDRFVQRVSETEKQLAQQGKALQTCSREEILTVYEQVKHSVL